MSSVRESSVLRINHNILRRSALFATMDTETMTDFIAGGHLLHYKKGQDVFSLGDKAETLFFVIDGWVKLYRMNSDGEEVVITIVGPGETFAEAAVFSQLRRYPVAAQACEESVLLLVPREMFVQKIKQDSEFSLGLLGAISSRQRLLVQQIEQISMRTPPQRVGTFLLQLCLPQTQGQAIARIPYEKYLLAHRLNIKPETFSRALRKLESVGVVAQGHQIEIASLQALRTFCDVNEDVPF
jgi:CRP-like cAMP-binding protein